MKLLYLHQHFVTPSGAGGIRSYAIAQKLIQRGHDVTVVCGSMQGSVTGLTGEFSRGIRCGSVNGINVIELDLPYSNSDGFFRRSLTFLRYSLLSVMVSMRGKYDLVFATSTPLTAGIPGIVLRWVRGIPFVFEVRDLWPELPRAMGVIRNRLVLGALSALEWISYRSADRLIGLSPGIVNGIARRGVPLKRINMIPNGCDLNIFSQNQAISQWRPSGIGPTDFLAIYAGTYGLANGLDSLLDAAAELVKRNRSDIKLLLIGQGRLKVHLKRRVETEGLTNVLFHDAVDKHRLAGLFSASDIGLQILLNVEAFYYGTSPNKFFDYIASGLPVLVNYPGWLADLISQHNCGFCVSPDNAVAFADALEYAAANRDLLKNMRLNSSALASSEFSRDHLTDQWVNWVVDGVR